MFPGEAPSTLCKGAIIGILTSIIVIICAFSIYVRQRNARDQQTALEKKRIQIQAETYLRNAEAQLELGLEIDFGFHWYTLKEVKEHVMKGFEEIKKRLRDVGRLPSSDEEKGTKL